MAMGKLKKGAKNVACVIGGVAGLLVGTTCLIGGVELVFGIVSEAKDYTTYGEECVESRQTITRPMQVSYVGFKACRDNTFELKVGNFGGRYVDVMSGNITPEGFKLTNYRGFTPEDNHPYWSSWQENILDNDVEEYHLERIVDNWRSKQNNQ